ncbi:MAG: hypothetical protein IKO42_02540, partial [Opitutales bacterium]|nr:hypothetical protein [Opitutales bacterium]
RFADFLLSAIAANDGDEALARERFDRAFKNLPENNELNLAKNFANFCDINEFYKYEAENLKPFFMANKTLVLSDSMLSWQFAKALIETGDEALAGVVLKNMFKIFAGEKSADGVDKILFDERACKILKDGVEAGGGGLAGARAKIIKGETEDLKLPEDASVGLVLKFLQLKKPVSEDDLNRALESEQNSEFEWQAWYALAANMFEEGQYEVAYAEAMCALRLAPDSLEEAWPIHILMGDCLRFQKKYKEAREAYLKVALPRRMQGEPAAEAVYKCGLSYFEEEKWANAYECFQRVFNAYFGFEKWSSRAYYYGAKALLELGDNVGARNVLREYLKYSRQKDSEMYKRNAALWSRIKLN